MHQDQQGQQEEWAQKELKVTVDDQDQPELQEQLERRAKTVTKDLKEQLADKDQEERAVLKALVVLQVELVEWACKEDVEPVVFVELQDKMAVLVDQDLLAWRVNKAHPAPSVYVDFQDLMEKRV